MRAASVLQLQAWCAGQRTCRGRNAKVDEAPALRLQHPEAVAWLDVPMHKARAVHHR